MSPSRTPESQIESVQTPTDSYVVGDDKILRIEGCAVPDLLARYGSPLYVVSERTLRSNFRRIRKAFSDQWGSRVNVLYAIKANNNPAVRAILHEEGAGGDCFGLGELHATFAGGADPDLIVLNGNNKSCAELAEAIGCGVIINIDDETEIADIEAIGQSLDRKCRVNIRLKIIPEEYKHRQGDYFKSNRNMYEYLKQWKWGFSSEAAADIIAKIRATKYLELCGYMAHTGRVNNDPESYAEYAQEVGRTLLRLEQMTGFWPRLLDIGGGWARQRDPESRSFELNSNSIETHAEKATAALSQVLRNHSRPLPQLWIEPGRYIVGNAVYLLGTVGRIKRDHGVHWVSVDFSTNNLMRIETSSSAYHVVPATRMDRQFVGTATLVSPTCTDAIIASDWPVPADLKPGEPVAVLDAGMYAETTSNQFNGLPRPATVLVNGSTSEIIKRRETVEDVFRLCEVPERLARH